jgi:TatD DNase family protein
VTAATALVDIGVNLAHDSFDPDRAEVVARARHAGVATLVVTGTSVTATAAAVAVARTLDGHGHATAGIHPHHAGEYDAGARDRLAALAADPLVVAVGECGLDYHRNYSSPEDQRRAFAGQLALAVELQLPVFLHERDAHADFLAMLREYRPHLAGGVAHCFTGGPGELEAYLELKLAIGITGWIADERRAEPLRAAVARLPLDRVLVETDAPYLLPRTLKPRPASRRNEPAFLPEVVRELARWMQQPVAEVAAASTRNARALFRIN